jgi:predicted O-methyltransferase YrrM
MAQKEKKYLSTSKHYLSQKFWRFLRHIIPLKLWNALYAKRQKLILNDLKKQLENTLLQVRKIDSINLNESLSSKFKDTIVNRNDNLLSEINELKTLFNSFESDKAILHNYNYLYAALFSNFKNNTNDILEVGTYKGASLKSWKAYFIKSRIYGIDIDPDTVFEEDRIKTMIADQNSLDSLSIVNSLWKQKYDVIIDDGWHQPEASVYTMIAFISELKPKGIYVLEDIDQERYRKFYGELAVIFRKYGYYSEYIDLPKIVPPTNSGYNYGVLVIENI